MIKKYFSVFVIALFLILAFQGFSSAQEKRDFRIGFMYSYPSYGLSGIMEVNDKISVQGIMAPAGVVGMYSVRGLYTFEEREKWFTYGYGSIGMWNYDYLNDSESSFGFSAGAGIEYDLSLRYGENFPPITTSLEVGFGSVGLEYYDHSLISIGWATHYKF